MMNENEERYTPAYLAPKQFRCQTLHETDYLGGWPCVARDENEAAELYLSHLRERGVETSGVSIRVMRIEWVIFHLRTVMESGGGIVTGFNQFTRPRTFLEREYSELELKWQKIRANWAKAEQFEQEQREASNAAARAFEEGMYR